MFNVIETLQNYFTCELLMGMGLKKTFPLTSSVDCKWKEIFKVCWTGSWVQCILDETKTLLLLLLFIS